MPSSDRLEAPGALLMAGETWFCWHVQFYNAVSGEERRIALHAPDAELAEAWAGRRLCRREIRRLLDVHGTWTSAGLALVMAHWRRTVLVKNPLLDRAL